MKLNVSNVDAQDVFSVKGPDVKFVLDDSGMANVAIHVRLSEQKHLHYPNQDGKIVESTVHLDPDDYDVIVMVLAHTDDKTLGRTYRPSITVNGTTLISAMGSIPSNKSIDSNVAAFTLRVT